MKREAIMVEKLGAAGPYSHAVKSGEIIFLSGQAPIDPATGELKTGGITEQTRQCFANLFMVLQAQGLNFDHVQKVNVFLSDMSDFAAMNAVYEQHFAKPYPARTTVAAAGLPHGAKVEIEMIARAAGATDA